MVGTVYRQVADSELEAAYRRARETFRYFWREWYFEQRRIVSGFDGAFVKVAFGEGAGADERVEHMWIGDVDFDGETVRGTLINDPVELSNVRQHDRVAVPLGQVSDWLIYGHETIGGFTVQVMRSRMSRRERSEHDRAWGVDFGNPNEVNLVAGQKEHPEYLVEHPMCLNCRDGYVRDFLPLIQELGQRDEKGFTELHRQALAGNLAFVEALIAVGADPRVRTPAGKTPLDLARSIGWQHVADFLAQCPGARTRRRSA
ncbi:MAG: DUF2314 domain-containing protein [Micrococcales bacterium]|nr:DUF2314 domain-containing protein [Micrococcales bacterium]MCL2668348.1 DUF2314 domain-containing protein [Micrococcales bacterium]